MRNVVVASNKTHAAAIIAWCELDPDIWEPAAYGDVLVGRFLYARIVPPLEGVEHVHIDWILEVLIPRVDEKVTPIPYDWKLKDPEPDGPQYRTNDLYP